MVIDVIIPARNESLSIGKVIEAIPHGLVRDVIVCDNGSTDDTAAKAHTHGAVVIHEPISGYGRACQAGLSYIRHRTPAALPDVVVFLDGDFSDYPEEMIDLISPIRLGKDLVIGSRVKGGPEKGAMTFPQKFGNGLATKLIHLLYGVRFSDLGPFRAVRWDKLILLDMKDTDYGWTVEMQVKAAKLKLACAEVPVSYRKRIGKSKISGTVKGTLLAGHKILWTIFKSL